jgi:hypothetical protein
MHNSNNCRRVNATIQHLGLDVEIAEPPAKRRGPLLPAQV